MDSTHLKQDELLRYLQGASSAEELDELVGHVAFCDACGQRLDALRQIRSDLEGSWSILEKALESWQPDLPELQTAAASSSFDIAIRVAFDMTRNFVALGLSTVSALSRPIEGLVLSPEPQVMGVASPGALEAERHRQAAGRLVDAGSVVQAMDELADAEKVNPGAAQVSEMRITRSGAEIGKIIADASRRSLHVIIRPALLSRPDSGASTPEIALMSKEGRILETRRFTPVADSDYWLAQFENLEIGEAILAMPVEF